MVRPAAPITPVLIVFFSIAAFVAVMWLSLSSPTSTDNGLGWKTYTNSRYHFRIQYPALLKANVQNTPDEHTPLYITFTPLIQTGPVMAGVDELTLSLEDQSVNEFRTGQETILTAITVDGQIGYRSAVKQGIEGLYQFVYISLGEQTVTIVASGKRIALLSPMIASFHYLTTTTACTDEAKLCPDGSAVGRTGPNCAFAACPGTTSNTNTANTNTSQQPTVDAGCYVGGCSGQVCSDQPDVVTDCSYREEYQCYKTAHCVKKANGQCGWESTPTLNACLDQHTEPITESSALTITAVTDNPELYDNRQVCLSGWYQSSFEFTAMGPTMIPDEEGNGTLAQPYVELYASPDEPLSCGLSGNTQACIGEVTECGTFFYAAPGETGFGVSENIRYQLRNE